MGFVADPAPVAAPSGGGRFIADDDIVKGAKDGHREQRRAAKAEASPRSVGNLAGAATEPMLALGTGAIAGPLSGFAGMAGSMIPGPPGQGARWTQAVGDALTYQPRTTGGQNAMTALSYPFEKVAEAADWAGGKTADITGSPALGAGLNAVLQIQAPGMAVRKFQQLSPPPGGGSGQGIADLARSKARDTMQSALKPPLADLRSGKAGKAIDTLLDEGVNVTRGGAEKLQGRIEDMNQRITDLIDNSPATIDKQHVGYYVQGTLDKFRKQVNAADDVAAIQKAWDEFLNDPNLPNQIPVKQAQEVKQGTYRSLGDKAYGELKGASIEAQKQLARGLKEEIARAVPEVRPLNAQESKLLNALSLVERRALIEANKNPAGLGWLTTDPVKFGAWMADRSGPFKSLVARMLNSAGEAVPPALDAARVAAPFGATSYAQISPPPQ